MRLIRAILATTVVTAALVVGGAVGAHAHPTARMECEAYADGISWVAPTASTYEYGDFWGFRAESWGILLAITPTWEGKAEIQGAPADAMTPSVYMDYARCYGAVSVYPGASRPLEAGDYSFTAKVWHVQEEGAWVTPEPARLTVVPAELGIRLRIDADPSNARNAIITAAFTGPFVERFSANWGSTTYAQAPLLPEGEWRIVVRDDGGEVVLDQTVPRQATDDILAVSAFWPDPAAGEYTATATFAPSVSTDPRFSIADAAPFSYTAVGPPPEAVPTATPARTALPAEPASATVPFAALAGVALLSLALAALLTVQIVRLVRGRRPRAATTDAGVTE